MIASPTFIFWTNLENLYVLILAIRRILHSMELPFDASLNSIRRILHSTDFPFDGIVFRRLQSVPGVKPSWAILSNFEAIWTKVRLKGRYRNFWPGRAFGGRSPPKRTTGNSPARPLRRTTV